MEPRGYIFIGGPHHRCSGLDVSGTLPYPTGDIAQGHGEGSGEIRTRNLLVGTRSH